MGIRQNKQKDWWFNRWRGTNGIEKASFSIFLLWLERYKKEQKLQRHTHTHTLLQTHTYILRLLQPLLSSISSSPEVAVPVLSLHAL